MRLARAGIWVAAALIVLVLAAALTLHWASRSERVLQWGVATLAARLPCALTVDGLSGSLSEPVRIRRLVCAGPTWRVEAADVLLDWSPWALLRERLDIARLTAASLRIESRGEAQSAPAAPPSLALPLSVHLGALVLEELTLQTAQRTVTLRAIDASYDGGARSHRLVLRRLESEWGSAAGEAAIAAQAPFALSAQVRASIRALPDWPVDAEIVLSGALQRIQAEVTATAAGLPLRASLALAPFAADPLPLLTAQLGGIDLRQFAPAAPTTALEVRFRGAARGFDVLAGELEMTNAAYGRLDENRLPVRTLAARAALTPTSVALQDLRVALGAAGAATGSARLDADGIQLDLATNDLDLRGLHAALRTTRLRGSAQVRVESGRQLIQADLRQDGIAMQVNAVVADQQMTIARLVAQAEGASVRAAGTIALRDALAFSADGSFVRFDPSRFADLPAAAINGQVSARGQLRPDWQVALRYRLDRSRVLGEALTGDGRLTLSARRVHDADARLGLGGNRLTVRGGFGAPGDQLAFRLEAPRLAALYSGLSGSASASGTVSGTPAQPALDASLDASALRYRNWRVQRWTLSAQVAQAEDPRLRIVSRLEQPARGDLALDTIDLVGNGTLSRHTLEAHVVATDTDLRARADGGYDRQQRRWAGRLLSLANRGAFAFALTEPATLAAGTDAFALGRAEVTFAGGNLTLEDTRLSGRELVSAGSMTGMPLARLLALHPLPRLQSTLVLGGRWTLRGRERLEGSVELVRERGDIVIPSEEQPLALGLSELRLTAQAAGSALRAQASVRGTSFSAQASGETVVSERAGRWGVAADAPLQFSASASASTLRPVMALFSSTVTADGTLALRVQGSGTVADPQLRGDLEGDGLRIEQVEAGVFLREGVLRARFDDRSVALQRFSIRGGDGQFSASGRAGLVGGKPALALDWSAEKLAAVQHPDLRLVVTGNGKVAMQDGTTSLGGALRVDQGRVELRSNTAPALGDDVVVAGRKQRVAFTARELRPEVDLTLDLGPDFVVRGRGLDATLVGSLRLTSAGNAPLQAKGEISVARGSYQAYGQKLTIDEGKLFFSGPIDNPGLKIRAMRKNQQVEAGVEVTGTARNPSVALVSDPQVPDAEKLSWLVLGQQTGATGTADAEKLQAAAVALAAGLGTAPLQQQLARAVGLDEIRFSTGTGNGQGGMVAVGKRISDRIYVAYEQSLTSATNLFKVSYQLTRNWSVRTESGTTDAVDLFYTISFD